MKRRILAGLLAGGLLLSGCKADSPAKGQVTLHTVSMFGEGDSSGPAYQELIAGYMREHPGVTVEDASAISSEEWKQGVTDSFEQAETVPDVLFYFTGADARRMILNNQFVSVEEIKAVYPDYAAEIRASTMQFMKEFDGNHYAVPVKGFWEGLFCNKDLFEKYNAPLPTDWASLERAISILKENEIVPIAASLNEVPHYWIEHLILSEGGAVEHRLSPKGYVPESWVKGIGWFQTLYDLSAFPADTATNTNEAATNLFLQKKAAMTLDGSWLVQSVTDVENTIVMPFPAVPGGKMKQGDIISGYSSGFYITRKAWEDPIKREAAVSFVRYMTTAESAAALCAKGGAPAVDIPQGADNSALQLSALQLQQNAENACMPIDSKLYKEAWQYLCGQVPSVAQGKTSPREVIEQLSKVNQW